MQSDCGTEKTLSNKKSLVQHNFSENTCKSPHSLVHCQPEQPNIAKQCLPLARHDTHCMNQHNQTPSDEGSHRKPTKPYLGSLSKPDGGHLPSCHPMHCESHYDCMMGSIRPQCEKIDFKKSYFPIKRNQRKKKSDRRHCRDRFGQHSGQNSANASPQVTPDRNGCRPRLTRTWRKCPHSWP